MPQADGPLTLERILATAEDVIRRFGPTKATLIDVARALGVSHAAVYRHVGTKAELRDLVVGRWIETTMAPLREIAAAPGPAPERLRKFYDTLMASKRRRATDDRELFAAYRALSQHTRSIVAAHVEEIVALTGVIIEDGIREEAFRNVDPLATGKAVLVATLRFHHPMHADEWNDPALGDTFENVWELIMRGLSADGQ